MTGLTWFLTGEAGTGTPREGGSKPHGSPATDPPVSFFLPGERPASAVADQLSGRTSVIISQQDIARLSDDTIRRMVIDLIAGRSAADSGAARSFSMRMAAALARALKERHRLLIVVELELLIADDEAEGSLVEPGTDPVAEAVAELRRDAPGSGGGPV
jgi:hypothetical protein